LRIVNILMIDGILRWQCIRQSLGEKCQSYEKGIDH